MSGSVAPGGLSCELNLPLRWSVFTDETGRDWRVVEQENINRIQVVLGLDDPVRELHEDEAGLAAEIQRLDFKINTILEMVAQLVVVGRGIPLALPLMLSADEVTFSTSVSPPNQGDLLVIELFPESRFPFSLVLKGVVSTVKAGPQTSHVTVLFDQLSEPFLGLFEKYVFRCHRRHVARLRKGAL